jgi:hypothetical protein
LPTSLEVAAARTWPTLSALARLETAFESDLSQPYVRAIGSYESVTSTLSQLSSLSWLESDDACDVTEFFRYLSHLDVQRLRMMKKYDARSQGVIRRLALSALWSARSCLSDARKRLQWLISYVPVFAMLERVTLAVVVLVDPLELPSSADMHSTAVAKQAARVLGGTANATVYLALAPNREVSADRARYAKGVACWRGEMHKAVAVVASQRPITEVAPLRIVDVGAGAGDCLVSIAGILGPSRLQAMAYEPFTPAADRFPRAHLFDLQLLPF